jgi:long-chain acyl-CoA synthetase
MQVSGDLVLTGRAKDVIVLSNGENIEPQPIEDAILEKCSFADQVPPHSHAIFIVCKTRST